jgi:hypothetical protein
MRDAVRAWFTVCSSMRLAHERSLSDNRFMTTF